MVNYVFRAPWEYLFNYHQAIIREMESRRYKPNPTWKLFLYRGRFCSSLPLNMLVQSRRETAYPEHDQQYWLECLELLVKKIETASPGRYNQSEVYRLYSHAQEFGIT
jgi:uncharacterized protein (TIGR02328 family)